MSRVGPKSKRPRWIARTAIFAALWLVIAGDDPSSWIVGVPTVALAIWASLQLRGNVEGVSALRLTGWLRFIPFFLVESFRGGFDVASRVLRPRLDISPGFQSYRPRLVNPAAQVLFLDAISLLPGSLSADLRDGIITVHALDARADLAPELARLEQAVARLFGEHLEPLSA